MPSMMCKLRADDLADEIQANYEKFFTLAKRYTHIKTLDRDTLVTFVERIEAGDKIYPEGFTKMPKKSASFQQSVKIYYKFIGEIAEENVRKFPQCCP